MENSESVEYWNFAPERRLEVYYDLQEKLAGEYKNSIKAKFEWEINALANVSEPAERERLQAMHDATTEYIKSDKYELDALDHGARRIFTTERELHEAVQGVMCKTEYEFLLRKPFDEKLREASDLTDALKAGLESAKQEHADYQNRKPSVLKNIITLGRAGAVWESGNETLQAAARDAESRYWGQMEYVTSSLSVADAREHAISQVEKYYPNTTTELKRLEQQQIEHGIKNDPIRTYENEVQKYASDCSRLLKHEISAVEETLAARKASLEEHDKAKPGFVQNVLSLGRLSGEWNTVRASLVDGVSSAETSIAHLETRRRQNQGGDTPDALAWAKNKVMEVYPALAEAYDAAVSREWQAKNRERIEKAQEQSMPSATEKGIER